MNTFILMWNPAISSYTMEDFKRDLKRFIESDQYNDEKGKLMLSETDNEDADCDWEDDDENDHYSPYMNWSVYEHDKAEEGDRFFLVRVGEGNTGIVMAGYFNSNPYEDDDWRGSDRQVFYMDMDVEIFIDSDVAPHISTEQLMQVLPGFDWTGGHSGRMLSKDMAEKFEAMWFEFLYEHQDIFDNVRAYRDSYYNDDYINETLTSYLANTRENVCEVCGYDFKKIWGEDVKAHSRYILLPSNTPVQETSHGDNVWKHVHCICDNCMKQPQEAIIARLRQTKE